MITDETKKTGQQNDTVGKGDDFRVLADNALDLMIFRLDRRLRHVFVNQKFLEVTGQSLTYSLGLTNRELDMPEKLCDLWEAAFNKSFETGETQEIDFSCDNGRGRQYYRMRVVPENHEGHTETLLGIVRDVTRLRQDNEIIQYQSAELDETRESLKRSQKKLKTAMASRTAELENICRHLARETDNSQTPELLLKKSLTLLESFFTNTHFMLAYLDPNFNFIKVNNAYALAAGKTPEFFEGKNHFELYPHRENEHIFRRVIETGEPFIIFEKPFEYPDRPEWGTTYWDWSLHPLKDEEDEVVGLILGLVEVTERKRTEEALDRSRKIFRDTLEKSLDGVVSVDMDNHFLEVNSAFEEIVGYSREELRLMTVQEITPDYYYGLEADMMKDLLEKGYTPLFEKEYRRKDGSLVPVELRVYLSSDEKKNSTGMWAFVRNITERKQREMENEAYLSALKQSNQELEEFAYAASHDLQEPLRKIQMFGDRISENYASVLDERGRDYLRRMIDASTRMRNLIRALLEYSRISTRPRPFESVDMNNALKEALSNLEYRIQSSGGTVDADELPEIEADYQQMVQLIQNLLGNALKFHRPEVPPKVTLTVRRVNGKRGGKRKGRSKAGFYELRVKDNGIGFNPAHVDKMFMPFQRLHERGRFKGVGIGLSICRKIAERHGATITAESEEGKGSVFIVTLPLKQTLDDV